MTLRWNEPVFANGEIEFYHLKIKCSTIGEQQQKQEHLLQEKTNCQENVHLKAREREFVFKEDPKDNQVNL